ncbi:CRE-SER-4 protein-like protein [Leptotrombidium deliense]|uniref:CRE-SER-4 protein-like protein n=1 Tax=Leptotrombidium deliense TaxID=299467 RepID=A0A443SFA5_9ACAR|nr:CRE-SER-4 protein-like protein [Leptotrombidium deliense]
MLLITIGINIVIFWTIFSNLAVMLLIAMYKKLRQPRNFLIFSLAVTDFLVGVTVMPVMIFVEPKIAGKWNYGIIACDIYWIIKITVVHVSIYHLVMIALDCYLSLRNAFYAQQRTYRKIILMVLVAWISGVMPSLLLLSYKDADYSRRILEQKWCFFSFDRLFIWVTSGFGFWFPFCLICTLYWKIYKVSQKDTREYLIHFY